MDFCSLRFDLQKQSILNFIVREKACFARILTYCATHALPYPCTPTGVSCLSSELFCSLPACQKAIPHVIARVLAPVAISCKKLRIRRSYLKIKTILQDCHGRKRPRNDKIGPCLFCGKSVDTFDKNFDRRFSI